jgi:putative DNA primase/helicase
MATCIESNAGAGLNEAVVKALTGGDTITARPMYGHLFSFVPTHKLRIATNHKPVIAGIDDGIWRRIRLIPWTQKFSNDPADRGAKPARPRDQLLRALMAERSGILNWLIRGCLAWQREGLGTAPDVDTATRAYRAESDPIGAFLVQCCEVGEHFQEPATALFHAFQRYEQSQDHEPLHTQTAFGRYLNEKGHPAAGKRFKVRLGLRLADETQNSCDSLQPENVNFSMHTPHGKVTKGACKLSQPSPTDEAAVTAVPEDGDPDEAARAEMRAGA